MVMQQKILSTERPCGYHEGTMIRKLQQSYSNAKAEERESSDPEIAHFKETSGAMDKMKSSL